MSKTNTFKFGRRAVLGMGVALTALAAFGIPAPASAAYPEKPVTVVIGWGPGGGIDSFVRVVEKHIKKYMPVGIDIVYKPGGAGKVSHNLLVSQYEPDGYTIAAANLPNQVIQTQLSDDGFRMEDITWVANMTSLPSTIMVMADGPFKTLDDLIKAAKADPGKLKAGCPGATSGSAAFHYTWGNQAKADITLIPYRDGSLAYKGILGKEVDVLSSNANWGVRYKDTLRTIAVASPKRYALLPDVPTMKELGFNYVDYVTRSFTASAKVPKDRIKVLSDVFGKLSQDKDYIADLEKVGLEADYMDSDTMTKFAYDYLKDNKESFELMKKKMAK